jgi:hypothetical protein
VAENSLCTDDTSCKFTSFFGVFFAFGLAAAFFLGDLAFLGLMLAVRIPPYFVSKMLAFVTLSFLYKMGA